MKRKVTKYAVIVISILLAELMHEYIRQMFSGWVKQSQFGLYASVLLSMLLAVMIFYPAFHIIERYLKFASKKYVKSSRKIGKGSFLGIVIGFGLALLLLFIGFCEIWYNQNPLANIFY